MSHVISDSPFKDKSCFIEPNDDDLKLLLQLCGAKIEVAFDRNTDYVIVPSAVLQQAEPFTKKRFRDAIERHARPVALSSRSQAGSSRARLLVAASRAQVLETGEENAQISVVLRAIELQISVLSADKVYQQCRFLLRHTSTSDHFRHIHIRRPNSTSLVTLPESNAMGYRRSVKSLSCNRTRALTVPFIKLEERCGAFRGCYIEFSGKPFPRLNFLSPPEFSPFCNKTASTSSKRRKARKRRKHRLEPTDAPTGTCEACGKQYTSGIDQHRATPVHIAYHNNEKEWKSVGKWIELYDLDTAMAAWEHEENTYSNKNAKNSSQENVSLTTCIESPTEVSPPPTSKQNVIEKEAIDILVLSSSPKKSVSRFRGKRRNKTLSRLIAPTHVYDKPHSFHSRELNGTEPKLYGKLSNNLGNNRCPGYIGDNNLSRDKIDASEYCSAIEKEYSPCSAKSVKLDSNTIMFSSHHQKCDKPNDCSRCAEFTLKPQEYDKQRREVHYEYHCTELNAQSTNGINVMRRSYEEMGTNDAHPKHMRNLVATKEGENFQENNVVGYCHGEMYQGDKSLPSECPGTVDDTSRAEDIFSTEIDEKSTSAAYPHILTGLQGCVQHTTQTSTLESDMCEEGVQDSTHSESFTTQLDGDVTICRSIHDSTTMISNEAIYQLHGEVTSFHKEHASGEDENLSIYSNLQQRIHNSSVNVEYNSCNQLPHKKNHTNGLSSMIEENGLYEISTTPHFHPASQSSSKDLNVCDDICSSNASEENLDDEDEEYRPSNSVSTESDDITRSSGADGESPLSNGLQEFINSRSTTPLQTVVYPRCDNIAVSKHLRNTETHSRAAGILAGSPRRPSWKGVEIVAQSARSGMRGFCFAVSPKMTNHGDQDSICYSNGIHTEYVTNATEAASTSLTISTSHESPVKPIVEEIAECTLVKESTGHDIDHLSSSTQTCTRENTPPNAAPSEDLNSPTCQMHNNLSILSHTKLDNFPPDCLRAQDRSRAQFGESLTKLFEETTGIVHNEREICTAATQNGNINASSQLRPDASFGNHPTQSQAAQKSKDLCTQQSSRIDIKALPDIQEKSSCEQRTDVNACSLHKYDTSGQIQIESDSLKTIPQLFDCTSSHSKTSSPVLMNSAQSSIDNSSFPKSATPNRVMPLQCQGATTPRRQSIRIAVKASRVLCMTEGDSKLIISSPSEHSAKQRARKSLSRINNKSTPKKANTSEKMNAKSKSASTARKKRDSQKYFVEKKDTAIDASNFDDKEAHREKNFVNENKQAGSSVEIDHLKRYPSHRSRQKSNQFKGESSKKVTAHPPKRRKSGHEKKVASSKQDNPLNRSKFSDFKHEVRSTLIEPLSNDNVQDDDIYAFDACTPLALKRNQSSTDRKSRQRTGNLLVSVLNSRHSSTETPKQHPSVLIKQPLPSSGKCSKKKASKVPIDLSQKELQHAQQTLNETPKQHTSGFCLPTFPKIAIRPRAEAAK